MVKNPRIQLQIPESDRVRWGEKRTRIKESGVNLNVVGRFLLDKLDEAEKKGFKELKKYIG